MGGAGALSAHAYWFCCALYLEKQGMSLLAFPEEPKVRELVELIRARLSHAQQLRLSGTPAVNSQVG